MRTLLLSLLVAGCSAPSVTDLYPHEVRYELMAEGTAEPCSGDLPVRQLINRARFEAIESVPGADGLLQERFYVSERGGKVCVTLAGRAYRVTALHAVARAGQVLGSVAPPALIKKPEPPKEMPDPFGK